MDPLHKVDYNEWRHGGDEQIDDEYCQMIRHDCIVNAVTTGSKLNEKNFNPMKNQFRVQLLQPKYTSLSSFQEYQMN